MQIRRETKMKLGWDCLHAECQHTVKGNHGIHGDEFHHAVIAEALDGRLVALVLTVSTNRYPPTVPQWKRTDREPSMGCDLTLHIQGPKADDGMLLRRGPCEWTANSLCETGDTTALGASNLWRKLPDADRDPEKPGESLWNVLEGKLKEHLADPFKFEQPDESWELRDARERLSRAQKLAREMNGTLDTCEASFKHFAAKLIEQRKRDAEKSNAPG